MSSGCTSSYSEKSEALPGAPQFLRVSEQYLSGGTGGYNHSIRLKNKIDNAYGNSIERLSSERQGRFYDLFDHQHANKTYLTEASAISQAERSANELARKIRERRLRPFRKQETSIGTIRTFPGRDYDLCCYLISINFDLFRGVSLSPELEVIKKANGKINIANLAISNLEQLVDERRVFEHFEDWISQCRSLLNSKEIKKKIANRAVHEKRRRNSMRRRFKKIIRKFRRVLAVRLDLGYRVEVRNKKACDDFSSDYSRLLNNLRMNHSLSKAIILMIAKVEYAPEKGFHVHFFIFLDGNVVRSDMYTAEQLGLYWKEVITKGDGVYFNGNRSSAKKQLSRYLRVPERNLALGNIDLGNVEQMKHVGVVIDYFSKSDQSPTFSGRYRKDLRIVRGPRMKLMDEKMRRLQAEVEVIDA